jgi:hypothetical protein
MAIQRMEHVCIVADLAAATEFFLGLVREAQPEPA